MEQPAGATIARPTPEKQAAINISVEAAAWVFLIAVAAAIRLVDLDGTAFSFDEGARSIDVVRVAGGDIPETWQGDLAAAGTSYLFRVLPDSETVARLAPALAGALVVAVIWLGREWLGRTGALAAGGLICLSPLFVLFSRSAEPFSLGTLVACLLVMSFCAYLRRPRHALLLPLVATGVVAPLTDAVATSALVAVILFAGIDAGLARGSIARRAWRSFAGSPLQWATSALIVATALLLGISHFGTSVDRPGLAGLSLWTDMFALSRDGREPEYHLVLLLAYDWPLLLAGTAGFIVLAARWWKGTADGDPSFEHFTVVWTVVAALTLALVTRREAGQLLILLLPLAFAAGCAAEQTIERVDLRALQRWWPAVGASLALTVLAALLLTEWANGDGVPAKPLIAVVAMSAAVFVLIAPMVLIGSRGLVLPTIAAAFLVGAFLAHSALAVAFRNGSEFSVDGRLAPRVDSFHETLEVLSDEREGTIVVQADLLDELGWSMRDLPVVFGGTTEGAPLVVARANEGPRSFVGLGDPWILGEGWYPEAILKPRGLWRWLIFREAFGSRDPLEVRIYVPTV